MTSSGLGIGSRLPSYLQQQTKATTERGEPVPLFIENNGFFPNVELKPLTDRYHVDQSFDDIRLMNLLVEAIHETNGELVGDQCRWKRSGYESLGDVPQINIFEVYQVDGEEVRVEVKRLVSAYLSAVYSKTLELLNEYYRGTDTKKYAVPKAEAMETVADNYEQAYRRGIYTLTGREGRSVFAELI